MKNDIKNLPHNWITVNIEEIATTSSGGTPKRSESSYYGGNIPWVKSGELKDGKIVEIAESITEEGLKNSSAKVFPKGTLCVAMYGATVGKVGILTCDAATNQAVCALFLSKLINTKYIFYLLKNIRKDLIATSKGGAQPNISQSIIKKTQIPLAPSNEQKRIADKIEMLQTKSKKAKQALETAKPLLDKLRQSILASAFRGDLTADWRKNNPDVEPAEKLIERILIARQQKWEEDKLADLTAKGKIPKNDKWKKKYNFPKRIKKESSEEFLNSWSLVRLADISDVVDPNPKHRNPKYVDEGFPFLSTAQFADPDGFDLSTAKTVAEETVIEQEKRCKYNERSIAFSRKGTIGKTRFVPPKIRFALLDSVCVINPTELIEEKYINYVIQSSYVQAQIEQQTRGVALKQVSLTVVRGLKIPIPPLDEQKKIVEKIEQLLGFSSSLEKNLDAQLKKINTLDQSILKKAFAGELVQQNSNDEPPSELLERLKK